MVRYSKVSSKKIFLIANSGFTILNFRRELIEMLIDFGCDVSVICPDECILMEGRNLDAELAELGVKFVPIYFSRSGINPFSELRLLVKLLSALKKEKPDVVLNYTIKPTIYGSLAARLAGVKYIASNITGLGYAFTNNSIKSYLLSFIIKMQYKIALSCNNLVFFQNPDDKALFESLSLIDTVKSKVIRGSGVNTDKFIRQNFKPKRFSFIFVGRLLKDKGVYEFVQAAELLKCKYPDASFTLLGSKDDNPSALSEKELSSYVSLNIINYLPTSNNVKEVLEDYEVLVLPSYREGTPRSVLEAMSMSMPIVTTDVPGCRETVKDGFNGFLVESKNIEALANAMERFIVDHDLVKKLGESSRDMACQYYDVKKVNNSIASEFL